MAALHSKRQRGGQRHGGQTSLCSRIMDDNETLTSALVALLVQTPAVQKNSWNENHENHWKDKDKGRRRPVLPDELFADGAEGRLGEEGGAELVTLDQMDFGLFDGAASLMQGEQAVSAPLGLRVGAALTRRV